MSLAGPPPVSTNPVLRLVGDLRAERNVPVPFPPGDMTPSLRRTKGFAEDPLTMLLDAYERHGPVFTQRIFHGNVVFMLGPEANHFITVSHAGHFTWREGHMGDLMPLLGDGLLTIDGDFHRRSRRIMLPAFHRERVAATLTTMQGEIDAALAPWHDGARLDLYTWTRRLALRVAMRALFGLDPDGRLARQSDAATDFEHALGFWSRDYFLQIMRGPFTPWARLKRARSRLDALIYDEIRRRRGTGERGEDILSLLLDARDDDGSTLTDQHIRDEVMTLLFAGHDTTTSTVAFLFYELSRDPDEDARLAAEVGDRDHDAGALMGGEALPRLEMALDETLRLWPAAWIGPRHSARSFEFAGVRVPAGVPVNYSSWVSHRLPDVWDEPHAFRPERFAPEAKARLPKGAYVPFGGGTRMCIGMRFGQLEIKAIATSILRRWRLEVEPGYALRVRQMPTIGPRDGLPVVVRARA
jgi:cytochrome P450